MQTYEWDSNGDIDMPVNPRYSTRPPIEYRGRGAPPRYDHADGGAQPTRLVLRSSHESLYIRKRQGSLRGTDTYAVRAHPARRARMDLLAGARYLSHQ